MIKNQNICEILENRKVSDRFFRLFLKGNKSIGKIFPGQFVHLRIVDKQKPFFRRPFSILRAKQSVEILYEVVGEGTQMLSEKRPGSKIDCVGPLGTPFSLPSKGTKQVVMIAGGVGVAPFLALSDFLKVKKYNVVLLYGGRTKHHIMNTKEFKANGCDVYIATDDGSLGVKGRVSKLFSKIKDKDEGTFIYTCGPKPMMAAVQQFARKHTLEGQASLEEVMACGIGTCLGCSTMTTSGYKTVCHDGPVFNLNEVIF